MRNAHQTGTAMIRCKYTSKGIICKPCVLTGDALIGWIIVSPYNCLVPTVSNRVEEMRVVFGGMGPTTKVLLAYPQWWKGREWSRTSLFDSLDVLREEVRLPQDAPGGMVGASLVFR